MRSTKSGPGRWSFSFETVLHLWSNRDLAESPRSLSIFALIVLFQFHFHFSALVQTGLNSRDSLSVVETAGKLSFVAEKVKSYCFAGFFFFGVRPGRGDS